MILSFYRCILTPNKVEFERLVQDTIAHYNSHPSSADDGNDADYLNNSRYIHRDEYISSLQNDKADNGYIHGDGGSSSSSSSNNDHHVEYRKVYSLSRALGGITILKKGTARMMIVMIMMIMMVMIMMMMGSMMVMIMMMMTMMIITMMMTIIMMIMML